MNPPTVFISYSHKDERLVRDLLDHLANLRRQSQITAWYDRRIAPGQNWQTEIDEHLSGAGIILLAISPYFMASDYSTGVELQKALELHRMGRAQVIPVILRPVDWEGAPFSQLQALPKNAKPVTEWRDRHQAFREIVRSIRAVLPEPRQAQTPASEDGTPLEQRYFLNHTSFLRLDKQAEFQARTGLRLDHYDIRIILDAEEEADLDVVKRVEYILHERYREPIRIRTDRDRKNNFLLKELANGEYLLKAKVFLHEREDPVVLYRYITLWHSGPELA